MIGGEIFILLFLMGALAIALVLSVRAITGRRIRGNEFARCLACGYDVTGLPLDDPTRRICPECGVALTPGAWAPATQSVRRYPARGLSVLALCLLLLLPLAGWFFVRIHTPEVEVRSSVFSGTLPLNGGTPISGEATWKKAYGAFFIANDSSRNRREWSGATFRMTYRVHVPGGRSGRFEVRHPQRGRGVYPTDLFAPGGARSRSPEMLAPEDIRAWLAACTTRQDDPMLDESAALVHRHVREAIASRALFSPPGVNSVESWSSRALRWVQIVYWTPVAVVWLLLLRWVWVRPREVIIPRRASMGAEPPPVPRTEPTPAEAS